MNIVVKAKRLVEPRDIPRLKDQLAPDLDEDQSQVALVAARYLSPTVRNRLVNSGLSYADATGNLHIRAGQPALFVADRGADHDPWRGPGRPRETLKGAPAAQVVRTLVDHPGPWRVRQLIKASQASTGSMYRVIGFLESESLVTRNEQGLICVSDWSALLRRWSDDYQFLRTNTVTRWIAPRGLENLTSRVVEADTDDYAVTGTIAAATWAPPYAPARSLMAFANNPETIATRWGLRATETGANVLLAVPAYPALLAGARQRDDGMVVAAPAQVAADLLTGPGRAPSEAEALMDWMKANEHIWR